MINNILNSSQAAPLTIEKKILIIISMLILLQIFIDEEKKN